MTNFNFLNENIFFYINNFRSYGSVFKAIRKSDGKVVAIKQVPIDEDIEELRKEIDIMKQCTSPFIISYEGTFFKGFDEIWVIYFFFQINFLQKIK